MDLLSGNRIDALHVRSMPEQRSLTAVIVRVLGSIAWFVSSSKWPTNPERGLDTGGSIVLNVADAEDTSRS